LETENQHHTGHQKITLNRTLGLTTSVLLVAGIMIGSGTFKKIAPMAQNLGSEPLILLAWITAGLITMLGAFTYAGLATVTNKSGGVYEYLRLAHGDFLAFLYGWSFFTIVGSGATAALAFIFSESMNTFIHFPDPFAGLKDVSLFHFIYPFADSGIKCFAVITICMLTWLNCLGIKQGGILNNIVTAAKILGILFMITASIWFAKQVLPEAVTTVSPVSRTDTLLVSSFFGAMVSALWAYDGWANITFITGEIKNPQRNLPLAIIGGVGIAMSLYVLLNYGYMRAMPLSQLAAIGHNKIAAVEVARLIMGNAGSIILSILIILCTFGAVNATVIMYPRLYYRMAEEKLFFSGAAKIHPRFRTPHISLIYSGAWCCLLVISGTFDLLTNLVVLASFVFFGLSAWGLIKLKRKNLVKSKVVGYPVTPYIIMAFSLILIVNHIITEPQQSLTCLLLILSGLPFYWFFKQKQAADR
jgi:APA family basic amino acid/polyamine antiporter